MKLKNHVIAGGIIAPIIFVFSSWITATFFFLGSFIGDIDHIIDFLWRTGFKNINSTIVRKTRQFSNLQLQILPHRKDTTYFFIFHTLEFLLLVYFLKLIFSDLRPIGTGVFWGASLHLALDIIKDAKIGLPREYSLTQFLLKKRQLKKRGIDSGKIFKEMLATILK